MFYKQILYLNLQLNCECEIYFFFSSTFNYQQLWSSNNINFFIFCYLSTVSAVTSVIKSITNLVLFTVMIFLVISNYILIIFNSCIWSLLNETEKQYYYNNKLCFYCRISDYWLNNCLWKCITHINEIMFQTSLLKQLIIKTSSVFINAFKLHSKNKWSFWIITQKISNQYWKY